MIYRPTRGELAMLESMLDEPRAPNKSSPTAQKLVKAKLAKWVGDELILTNEGRATLEFLGKERG